MGINSALFRELLKLAQARRGNNCNATLMLGRQRLNVWKERPKHPAFEGKRRFAKAAASVAYELDITSIIQQDKYSEKFFNSIGLSPIHCLDASPYEGAEIIHDLNLPIPEHLYEKYSVVLDGGTIEHVFNTPMAWANVFNLLKPGGVFIAMNPLNGSPTHGMYQISPEAVYTFWRRMAGCSVLDCAAMTSRYPERVRIKLPDPNDGRQRLVLPRWSNVFSLNIFFLVQKEEHSMLAGPALQSDYIHKWTRSQSISDQRPTKLE